MDSKLKKSLKPLNQGSIEFKPSNTPISGDILKNNSLSLTATILPSTNNEKTIAPNWEKPIVTDPVPALKKEDPPKKKLQNTRNNDFQPSQQPTIEKESPEQKKNVASTVPVVDSTSPIPQKIEPIEVKTEEKTEEAKPIEELKLKVEEVKPIQIEETPKNVEPAVIKKSIIIDIIKVIF